ncbi:MAG: cupin domain-containing protein [Sphingomonadales bacterium]|nr:cupin domain-containing protein [Sphingomonadales bacterium]
MIHIDREADSKSSYEYGCDLRRLFPWQGVCDPTYWGGAIASVRPGEATTWDCHDEMETFILIEGRGVIEIDEESEPVSACDVIVIPRNSRHRIKNEDQNRNLKFVSIYWDSPAAREGIINKLQQK